jgi:hypothetical protein
VRREAGGEPDPVVRPCGFGLGAGSGRGLAMVDAFATEWESVLTA